MADFLESNLCSPSAPIESLWYKRRRKSQTASSSRSRTPPPVPPAAVNTIWTNLLQYFNVHFKKYSPLQQVPSPVDPVETPVVDSLEDRVQGEHTAVSKHSGRPVLSKYFRKKRSNRKSQFLVKIYLAVQRKRGKMSDEERLLESPDSEDVPAKKKRRLKLKGISSKKIALKNTYATSKRVLHREGKRVTRGFREGCIRWAYGVVDSSSAMPYVFSPSGIGPVSQFHFDADTAYPPLDLPRAIY